MNVLGFFDFLRLQFVDILDIAFVTLIIFFVFRWIKTSSGFNIFLALIILYFIKVLVSVTNMKMTSALLNTFVDVGVLALIVIFQPEIRKFLMRLGSNRYQVKLARFLSSFSDKKSDRFDSETIDEIAGACNEMSSKKTGALIVIPRHADLTSIVETGDRIDSLIKKRIIMNLFFKNSPLHDGAVIIDTSRIVAARCTLPITNDTDVPPSFGMRHKAAIGVSQEYDVFVIIVSEQDGHICCMDGGAVRMIDNINTLKLILSNKTIKV